MFGPNWEFGQFGQTKRGQLTEFLQTGEQADRGIIPRSIHDLFEQVEVIYAAEGIAYNIKFN